MILPGKQGRLPENLPGSPDCGKRLGDDRTLTFDG
jgi:hypothetical protein